MIQKRIQPPRAAKTKKSPPQRVKLRFTWKGHEELEAQAAAIGRAYFDEADKIQGDDRAALLRSTIAAVSRGFPISDPAMLPFAEACRASHAFKQLCCVTHRIDISLVSLAMLPTDNRFVHERPIRQRNFERSRAAAKRDGIYDWSCE